MVTLDEYISDVVKKGDEGSKFLAAKCTPTLRNSRYVQILQEGMNGIVVLRVPRVHYVVVHSSGGDPSVTDLAAHSASLVDGLVQQAREVGATPLAFADVIDSENGSIPMLETIANAMVARANFYGLAIMNGENAILGNRIVNVANVSGTMISIAPKFESISPGTFVLNKNKYAVFDPEGRAVYINSDGVGTKTEFYERAKRYHLTLHDSCAMKVDDAIKLGATVKVISDVVETRVDVPIENLLAEAWLLSSRLKVDYILQHEMVGPRIRGFIECEAAYNISGSVVSTIDEERLKNPLRPHARDYVIAIRGKPNPRSNGITQKRKLMVQLFGEDWHHTSEGRKFLEYLAEPSTILYPVFKELVDKGLATSVYHMSGGAYDGKLARPLAKHGLFVSIGNLFPPDWRELAFVGASFSSAETAYSKWPMGNDGFVTTSNPEEAENVIKNHGLQSRVVGEVEACNRTGLEIHTPNGQKVYFSGK